jgi:hypothetical protein
MGGSASEVVACAEAVQGTVTHVIPRFIPTPTLQSPAMIPRMPQRTGQRYPSLWALQSVGAGQPLGVNSAAYTGLPSSQAEGWRGLWGTVVRASNGMRCGPLTATISTHG